MRSSNDIPFFLMFSVQFLDSLQMPEICQLFDNKYIINIIKEKNVVSFFYPNGFYFSRMLESFEKSILNIHKLRLILTKTPINPLFTIVAYLSRCRGRKHTFIFSNKIISLFAAFRVDFDFDYYYNIISDQEENIQNSCSNVDIYIVFPSFKYQYCILKQFYKNNKFSLSFRNNKVVFKFLFHGIKSIDSRIIEQSILFFEREISFGIIKKICKISDVNVVIKCELNQYEKVYFDIPQSFWDFLNMYNANLTISLIDPRSGVNLHQALK